MRYFRYQHPNKIYAHARKEQYKSLTDWEKRQFRSWRRWNRFAMIVTLLVYCAIAGGGICLLAAVPKPVDMPWTLLSYIGRFILGFFLLMASFLLTHVLTSPLWKKVESLQPAPMKKEFFAKACTHLRTYYGLQEPYIVTKCFDAENPKFKNHDVCIFVANGELRITADLVRGFLHGERDLGCYAFNKSELTLTKRQQENRLMLELNTDHTVFVLGYRAKGFIEQHFLGPESD